MLQRLSNGRAPRFTSGQFGTEDLQLNQAYRARLEDERNMTRPAFRWRACRTPSAPGCATATPSSPSRGSNIRPSRERISPPGSRGTGPKLFPASTHRYKCTVHRRGAIGASVAAARFAPAREQYHVRSFHGQSQDFSRRRNHPRHRHRRRVFGTWFLSVFTQVIRGRRTSAVPTRAFPSLLMPGSRLDPAGIPPRRPIEQPSRGAL